MTRFQKSMLLVAIGLGLFTLGRVALFVFHRDSFAELSASLVAGAFLNGTRFDLNVLLSVQLLPLVMMNLPLRSLSKRWFDAWAWVAFVPLTPLMVLLGGDVAYFSYVHRHLADELNFIGSDFDFVVGEAFGTYLPALGAALLGMVGVGWLWRLILSWDLRETRRPALPFLLLVALSVMGVRGTLDRKPLGLIDAYATDSAAFGNLSLNGIFSAFEASKEVETRVDHDFLDDTIAYAELGIENVDYPLLRRAAAGKPRGVNLLILLLESWDPRYIDSYEGGGGGVTPHFDALADQSLRFERCYAAGQRSLEAIQALLTGVPPIVGLPPLGWGLRLANISQIGTVARKHGYETLFIQSSRRRSYRMDSAARSLGFEHYYGQEDIPTRLEYPSREKPKWGWDYDTLMFALERIDAFDAPFLAFVFTGATHPPYPDPGERFHLRKHTTSGEPGFVNMLHYSDWSVGEFIAAARSRPWFDKTIFVFTADHIFRKAPREDDLRADFRVPFLLYGPAWVESGVDERLCSHLDGLPTFFDLLGFDEPYAAMGESLLHKHGGFALVKKGNLMGIITDRGSVTHSLEGRVSAEPYVETTGDFDVDTIERRLLASLQVTHRLLRTNRWAPPR